MSINLQSRAARAGFAVAKKTPPASLPEGLAQNVLTLEPVGFTPGQLIRTTGTGGATTGANELGDTAITDNGDQFRRDTTANRH